MNSPELTVATNFDQERSYELLDNLGPTYGNLMSSLITKATTRPARKGTVVVVGGLSESGKTVFVTQAERDFSDSYQVQRFEEAEGQRFQHLHLDLGDGMNLLRNRLLIQAKSELTPGDLIPAPKLGDFTPENYTETALIMANTVSYAATNTDKPRIIWVQSTLLPGLLEKGGQIDGLDKGLSMAASLVANLDAFTVLIFGSSETRALGASFKEEVLAANPEQIPTILAKYNICDTRSPQEIIDYTRDHSSNAKTRVQSLGMVEQLVRKMIATGEIQPPGYLLGDSHENDVMQYLKLEYAPAFLNRLYGGEVRRDRAFSMYNKVFRKGQTMHVYGSIYEQESLVKVLEEEARTSPTKFHKDMLYCLGIRV